MKLVLLFVLSFAFWAQAYPLTPETNVTPGSLCTEEDEDFYEYRYAEQIPYCERDVSSSLKTRIYEDYDIPKSERKDYTIDHFIPLSIGGTNHYDNLWPEHKEVKALRPTLEMQLYVALRDGELTQDEAVKIVMDKKLHPRALRARPKQKLTNILDNKATLSVIGDN